jgi:hypothetical protein
MEELYKLLGGPDIVKYIKSKRLQCAGHVVGMDKSGISKISTRWKFYGRRPVGRPRLRWKDNIRRGCLLLLNIR